MNRFRSLIALIVWLPMIAVPATASSDTRLQPDDFTYLGAFRLPTGGERPFTFEYGGSAITFNPDGDPGEEADDHGEPVRGLPRAARNLAHLPR